MVLTRRHEIDRHAPTVAGTISFLTRSTIRLFCKDSTPLAGNKLLVRKLSRTRLQKLLVARQSQLHLVQLIVNDRPVIEISRSITVQAVNFIQSSESLRILGRQNKSAC